ncbi:hypothetical protein [Legionella maceachernii]|uniref:hypothetical protein n=1 Tax=Legionella maceachernii TaxID=466 RepID=UPI0007304896|nr:hypothetical protein [Legionella maceachernii]
MRLLPRIGRSLAFARDNSGFVVPNEVRDLLGGYCQGVEEVLISAQMDMVKNHFDIGYRYVGGAL